MGERRLAVLSSSMVRVAWLLFVVASCTCRPDGVTRVESRVRLSPRVLELGTGWTRTTLSGDVVLSNVSRAGVTVTLAVSEPFTLQEQTLEVPPGDTPVRVLIRQDVSGRHEGQLRVTLEGTEAGTVRLLAAFADPPPCGEASECATFRFDRETSQCLVEPRPDGVSCGRADRCLVDGRCARGECVGQPPVCDDGDPCTIDVCDTVSGCVALPRTCPDPSPCQRGVCSRQTGRCEAVAVADGLRCGDVSQTSCTSVEICVNGQCVERDPPDGFICAPATPCRGEGRCEDERCVMPPGRPLTARWSAPTPGDDGGSTEVWHDLFLEPDGGVVLSSYFATPPMVQAPAGPRLSQPSRRCIAWSDLVVCADGPAQAVTGVSSVNGTVAWTYSTVLSDLPALALPDWETFLARLVVLGPSRVGAVYESRRVEAQRDTNCRRFSLVVLDGNGQRVVARIIDDPIFQTCNHPHSYGVAADPQGNVFFAFTPSLQVSPALPDPQAAGTVILSYSPAGVRRWRHFIPGMPGGEIAVGRGVITVEAGRSIYDSARGVVIGGFSIPFGEGLIAEDWVVAGPKGLQLELRQPGQDAGVVLASTGVVGSQSGLRGAAWGGQQVALRFSHHAAGTQLEAFPLSRFQSGRVGPLWTCEVPDGGVPVSFEVKANGVAVMTDPEPGGAGLCENCDPPWAGTRSRFFELEVPGLLPPTMPWPGPWGGAGHDHQED